MTYSQTNVPNLSLIGAVGAPQQLITPKIKNKHQKVSLLQFVMLFKNKLISLIFLKLESTLKKNYKVLKYCYNH